MWVVNIVCVLWLAVCFFFNWEPWLQVAILLPNMIAWTICSKA